MGKAGAGVLGFLTGGVVGFVLLLAVAEAQFQYDCARWPPEDDPQCFGPGIDRDFLRLAWSPLAVLSGGGVGCWLAIERQARRHS